MPNCKEGSPMNHFIRTAVASFALTLTGYVAADEISCQDITVGNLSTPDGVTDALH